MDILKQNTYTWLITGVAGFIGSNILEFLLNNNQKDFQLLPNATHKIYHNAGHDIAVQEPLAVATEIQKFIKHNYK